MGLHIPLWFIFFCMDVRRRLFFWSPITMMYPGGGEERLAASHLYPPFWFIFPGGPKRDWSSGRGFGSVFHSEILASL